MAGEIVEPKPEASRKPSEERYAIIAGNGHFPFLVLDAARDQGINPLIVAIKEEAWPDLGRQARAIHWLSLGEVGKLLGLLESARGNKVVLAGQGQHAQPFNSLPPDGVVRKALQSTAPKKPDALIGAVRAQGQQPRTAGADLG